MVFVQPELRHVADRKQPHLDVVFTKLYDSVEIFVPEICRNQPAAAMKYRMGRARIPEETQWTSHLGGVSEQSRSLDPQPQLQPVG